VPLIPYLDIADMPIEPRESLARQPRKLNAFRVWAHAKTCFAPSVRFGNALATDLAITPAVRELVILTVARIERGLYEWTQHIPAALAAGCRQEQIAAIEAGDFVSGVFDDRERALLRFVHEVVAKVRAREETVEAAKAYFPPQEIVEIILTAGFYMTITRMTETLRVDIDGPPGVDVPTFERMS
jgi:alkylhydroperoxidase family enzyme